MTIPSDPRRGGRLLRAEGSALLPILRTQHPVAFDKPTLLPGWSVRDVLAHCSAALKMASTGQFHDFSPASNEKDVVLRREWPLPNLLDELAAGYDGAAAAIDAVAGRLDGLALGEWVHGGDVRHALGLADAYASEGLADALVLLTERSRGSRVPATDVTLAAFRPDPDAAADPEPNATLRLGPEEPPPAAVLATDPATLIRLCAARTPDPSRFTLSGAQPEDYRLFT
jgi:uncharacterized protein (TIGR03083 family)